MTKWLSYFLLALAIAVLAITIIPLLPFEYWMVRVFDFPRVQILILSLVVIAGLVILVRHKKRWWALIGLLFIASLYQIINILPYTPIVPVQALAADAEINDDDQLKILVANVYMKNTQHQQFIELIEKQNPDIFLTLETDQKWQDAIDIIKDYPFNIKVPIANTYGMHLYSKLPLNNSEVKYWLDKEIPSIHTFITLKSGNVVEFYGVHPRPPVPTEDQDSRKRDAEILIVANRVADSEYPVIVAGDFNDVAWSPTTKLFLKSSGLLDPRIGRGLYNTYNAKNVLFRWPLDHFFYSTHFKLINMQRLPHIESDHFPISISLVLKPEEKNSQKPMRKDTNTKKQETETINEGIKDANQTKNE